MLSTILPQIITTGYRCFLCFGGKISIMAKKVVDMFGE